ncbi:MAG: RecX family transcriptional regulator [Chloroflexi bacterium]|nr:RecX family transcriptional regulator [Chloroflexota bacterium]
MTRTITAIEQQERRGGQRSNVFLDGRYAFSLSTELAITLHVGESVSETRHAELVMQDQHVRAYDAALHFLGSRPRSEREIRDRLARHEYDRHVVDKVIERLRRIKLVDDAAFAAYWVEQRATHRPRGARLLKQELRQKGVSQDVVAEALPEDDDEGAYRAAERKAISMRALDERTFKQRLGGFLQRRGYGYETVRRVVGRLWAEHGGGGSAEDAPEDDVTPEDLEADR